MFFSENSCQNGFYSENGPNYSENGKNYSEIDNWNNKPRIHNIFRVISTVPQNSNII